MDYRRSLPNIYCLERKSTSLGTSMLNKNRILLARLFSLLFGGEGIRNWQHHEIPEIFLDVEFRVTVGP